MVSCPDVNELLLRPSNVYPTLLQGIIPSPFDRTKSPEARNIFDFVKMLDYPTRGWSREVLDRCIVNVVQLGCEYSQQTMRIIEKVIDEVKIEFQDLEG